VGRNQTSSDRVIRDWGTSKFRSADPFPALTGTGAANGTGFRDNPHNNSS